MRGLCIAFGVSLCAALFVPPPAAAQKIIQVNSGIAVAAHGVRVRKFGRVVHPVRRKARFVRAFPRKRARFVAFALPEQTLFPPYYEAARPWAHRPDMASRIEGGRTVEGGSRYASHVAGGSTVQGGSPYASHIAGGRTVEGGSRYASHIRGGRTVEQGSQWGSTMPNWRFSGYAAPVRPRGISYYRASSRARSPWAGRF